LQPVYVYVLPYEKLALNSIEKLKKIAGSKVGKNDPAHDFDHIMRVYNNSKKLAKKENGKARLVLAAALLHDIVSYSKSDPRSRNSSVESAKMASKILARQGYTVNEIKIISDAIRDHSFSRGLVPKTLTGKILQDADRLDAIGSIGIARAFSVGGSEGRHFYNIEDPFCEKREPNDTVWTLDHFYKKLLLLEKKMNTKSAKIEAKRRTKLMKQFLDEFKTEI
jgi:uncharacterized protein